MEPNTLCMFPPHDLAASSAETFRAAARELFEGDAPYAIELLRSLPDAPLREHYRRAEREYWVHLKAADPPVPPTLAVQDRPAGRMPSKAEQVQMFIDHGWRCQWCSVPVIYGPVFKAVVRRLQALDAEDAFYWRDNTVAGWHGLILAICAYADHVVAHSRGGTFDRGNMTTSCCQCNFARGDLPIEHIGILHPSNPQRIRPSFDDDWDGCYSIYRGLAADELRAPGPNMALDDEPSEAVHPEAEDARRLLGIRLEEFARGAHLKMTPTPNGLSYGYGNGQRFIYYYPTDGRMELWFGCADDAGYDTAPLRTALQRISGVRPARVWPRASHEALLEHWSVFESDVLRPLAAACKARL